MQLNNYITGSVQAPVYDVNPANPLEIKQGNTSAGLPTGTQTAYAGAGLLGAGFTAQLFAGPLGTADDALQPVAGTTTFRTSTAAAGRVNALSSVSIPGVAGGTSARVQLRVWENRAGTITSWADVLADDSVKRGYSLAWNSLALGDPFASPPGTPATMFGVTSFQLFVVPEPSIIALGALGLGALILFRRRK
jgi:hypothetical protein